MGVHRGGGGVVTTGALGVSGGDTITTVAGSGVQGFAGDGGPATAARLFNPSGVATDKQGAVYLADTFNQRVRKIAGGVITTFAGNGVAGYSGDGGAATAAQLNFPTDVAVDAQGTVYIADQTNHRVRMVSNGIITTLAGTGIKGFFGDGGPARDARFDHPSQLAIGPAVATPGSLGSLYVSDSLNHRVRVIGLNTTAVARISTVAGTGTAGYSGDGGPAAAAQLNIPGALDVDAQRRVFIADVFNQRIRMINSGVIGTVAGTGIRGFSGDGGLATAAQIASPNGLAVDARGALYISDTGNDRVRKVEGATIATIAGTGTSGFSGDGGAAASAQIASPTGLTIDARGNLLFVDQTNQRVRMIANAPPIASFTATPLTGRAPLDVRFDASASLDPGGSIGSYEWAFGDGATATGATATHTYTKAGTYTAKLTVTDALGASVTATRTVTVTPAPPPPTPPKLTLRGATSQRLLTLKRIVVVATCDRPCALSTTGKVFVRGTRRALTLNRVATELKSAGSRTLTLRISTAKHKRLVGWLKPGKRARAVITVRAESSGLTTTAIRVVAVRR